MGTDGEGWGQRGEVGTEGEMEIEEGVHIPLDF